MSYDAILEHVGPYGFYQKRALFYMLLLEMPFASNILATVFMLYIPNFRCVHNLYVFYIFTGILDE